jgi:pimeloyl-ACP methyl ester carboxylesterase
MAGVRLPRLLIATAVAVVIVVGVILVPVLAPPGRLGPVPLSEDGVPSSSAQLLPANERSSIPVVLVHGYAGAPSQMQPLADRLRRDGRVVSIVRLPERGTVDIRTSAGVVDRAAKDLHATTVDVVGFSLGGVAARQSLLLHDPEVRYRHVVLLATPNNGVRLPDDSGRPEQQHCEPNNACGQLAPGAPFLRALNANPDARGRADWLTVASTSDRLVRPPAVVALAGAENLVLQQVCPGVVADHGEIVDRPAVLGLVSLFLDDRMPSAPTCTEALRAA